MRHLLSHTSGITYGIFGDNVCDQILKAKFTAAERADWMGHVPLPDLCDRIASTPLLFQPGTKWHYGFSSDVSGDIIAWSPS